MRLCARHGTPSQPAPVTSALRHAQAAARYSPGCPSHGLHPEATPNLGRSLSPEVSLPEAPMS